MKLNQIALAVAALAAAPAYALTPAQVAGATQLWITGASAPTNAVFQGVMTLCRGMSYKAADPDGNGPLLPPTVTNPGTLDAHMYLESTGVEPGKSSGDRVAYACTIQTSDGRAGSLENKKVVVYHTVEGGSFNAYAPALRRVGDTNANLPTTLQRITEVADLGATGECAAGGSNGVATTVSVSGVNNTIQRYTGCKRTTVTLPTPAVPAGSVNVAGDDAPRQSVGGFSDTEYLINKLNLGIATDLGTIGSETNTNIAQAFGVAVSYPLYRQLQVNQDLTTGACAGGSATAPVLTPVCQPSLPAQAYTAVVNQANAVGVNASLFGGAASGKVHLARRAITSGTQSASNLRFLNKPCATGVATGALEPARAADSTATFVVTEQSGTGGVKTALNAATGANEFGLGVMSLENVPAPTATADRWAFVKLNKVSPTSLTDGVTADAFQRAEALAGNYDFWYELQAFTSNVAGVPVEGVDLMGGITTSLSNPELTNLRGLFLTPLSGGTGSNVGTGTRFGNSCQAIGQ